jgi:hypothetical protein
MGFGAFLFGKRRQHNSDAPRRAFGRTLHPRDAVARLSRCCSALCSKRYVRLPSTPDAVGRFGPCSLAPDADLIVHKYSFDPGVFPASFSSARPSRRQILYDFQNSCHNERDRRIMNLGGPRSCDPGPFEENGEPETRSSL